MIFRHWKQELDRLPANCNKRVNSLSEEVKSCDSINSFKLPLKKEQNSPRTQLHWKTKSTHFTHILTNQIQYTGHWSIYQKRSRPTALSL